MQTVFVGSSTTQVYSRQTSLVSQLNVYIILNKCELLFILTHSYIFDKFEVNSLIVDLETFTTNSLLKFNYFIQNFICFSKQ